jgi:hypothetical protein
MNTAELFRSAAAALPRDRNNADFPTFLSCMMGEYLAAARSLDPACPFAAKILPQMAGIQRRADDVILAVRLSLSNRPGDAQQALHGALDFVSTRLSVLLATNVAPDELQRLFRMSKISRGEVLDRERLFHPPFDRLDRVVAHRYSLARTPCLYLGGSLALCRTEARIEPQDLPLAAIAEFGTRSEVAFLDFGYAPILLAELVQGRYRTLPAPNQALDDLIVNFAVCWPLIAASSVTVAPGATNPEEYIVPTLIMGWLTNSGRCTGIRYFSTRVPTDAVGLRTLSNFAFPAHSPRPAIARFCPELKAAFELTMPTIWDATTGGHDPLQEALDNEARLALLPRAPLP